MKQYIENKMKKLISLSLSSALLLLLLASCSSRYVGVKASDMGEVAFFQPRAIQFFFSSSTAPREPSLSKASEQLMEDLITSRRYAFSDMIAMDYGDKDSDIARWINGFSDLEMSDAKHLRVPKSLSEKIKASGHRYGIVVHAYGYIKSNELYDKERLAKLVDNILRSLFNDTPRYSSSDQYGNALYAAVVDTKTDRVVYFSRVLSNADHPLSRRCVGEQMKTLLRDFER